MDLIAYVKLFIRKHLNDNYYSVDDVASDVFCSILCEDKLSSQLREFVEKNEIPGGRNLSLLKAIIVRTKLKYINKENVHLTGRRKCAPNEVTVACLPEEIESDPNIEYFYSFEDIEIKLPLKARLIAIKR